MDERRIEPLELESKYQQLVDYFRTRGQQGIAIAFSGGVDSTLVLWLAHEAIGSRACAFIGTGKIFPPYETQEALDFCKQRQLNYEAVELMPLELPRYRENPADRCYICKRMIFSSLLTRVGEKGFGLLVDGTNADDDENERPGMRALAELKVASPLRELGVTKAEIRELSKQLGLPTWNKGSFACLMTRFPQGQHVSDNMLHMVGAAESYLLELGFTQLRVRWHAGDIARIELCPDEIGRLLNPEVRARVSTRLRELGFSQVTLDLSS